MLVVLIWRAVLDCPLPLVVQVLYVSGLQVEGCSGSWIVHYLDCPLPLVVHALHVSGRQMEGCYGLSINWLL